MGQEPQALLSHSARLVYDAAIIGGGVIGCSTAYWLSRRGLHAIVLEAGELGAGSSGACDGFLSLQSKDPGPLMDLARESVALYPELASTLPSGIEFNPCGGMLLARDTSQLTLLRDLAGRASACGLEVHLVGPAAAKDLEPGLPDVLTGATLCSAEGQVNPLSLTNALATAAGAMGTVFIEGCSVQSLKKERQGWSLLTSAGKVTASCVVCCAGARSARIGEMLGIHIPVVPLKGHLLVTEVVGPAISHILAGADYIESKRSGYLPGTGGERSRTGFTVEQTASGNLLVGSTRDLAGYDTTCDPRSIRKVIELSLRYMPALGRLGIIRVFTGLRPQSPDGLPIIGEIPAHAGFLLATGHGGDGIALAPITGKLVAEVIAGDISPRQLDPFRVTRFT